ncbi:UDP-N-acetylglucosamine--N-acetylmuramyl-(pentapeptide) pyrophosphoryl-undecaprenol N-acetylglucosamine transferase [Alphaproteobacteria bacterium]|nr:UDP-N-acetylglucosamine--N-acetylmuramyl-(pentapeptide) pyrophosphoryl-undecaprenol N-acetylglucosamine transferase [Alphaproteobacteria bacterium]
MKKNNNILICTGGTGGHVIPAVNFGNYLISKGYKCSLMLDNRGIKYANNFKGNIISIKSSHFSGNFYFKINSTFSLFIGLLQSIYYLVKILPRHCISFGSYASFTPLFVSIFFKFFKKISIHIHEQNSVMGKVNLFFLPYSNNIFTNFEFIDNMRKEFHHKSYHVGLPSPLKNKTLFDQLHTDREKLTIFIYGGSQGSKSIIEHFLLMFNELKKKEIEKIKLIIQSPNQLIQKVNETLTNLNAEYQVKSYYNNIHEILSKTDLAITRAGAGTINDLIVFQIPSILFPLPNSMNNHQTKNAEYLEKKQCAIIMYENIFNKNNNLEILRNLINDNKKRATMKKSLNNIPVSNANELMLKVLLDEEK